MFIDTYTFSRFPSNKGRCCENIPPARDGGAHSIAENYANGEELVEKISKSRVYGRNNGLILAQNSQNSSLDEEDGEKMEIVRRKERMEKIEQTLDAKGLHSLVEHSYSVEPSS